MPNVIGGPKIFVTEMTNSGEIVKWKYANEFKPEEPKPTKKSTAGTKVEHSDEAPASPEQLKEKQKAHKKQLQEISEMKKLHEKERSSAEKEIEKNTKEAIKTLEAEPQKSYDVSKNVQKFL